MTTPYKPLPYGSREYLALRKTVRKETIRWKISGRICRIIRSIADGPGLWTGDSAELFEVEIPAAPISGLGSNVTEILGSGFTRDEAIAAAERRLAERKVRP